MVKLQRGALQHPVLPRRCLHGGFCTATPEVIAPSHPTRLDLTALVSTWDQIWPAHLLGGAGGATAACASGMWMVQGMRHTGKIAGGTQAQLAGGGGGM